MRPTAIFPAFLPDFCSFAILLLNRMIVPMKTIDRALAIALGWLFCIPLATAQYAPAAGQLGSTALHRDSAAWVGWATQCTLQRGLMDLSQPQLGWATAGMASDGLGPSDGGIVSLGDGGTATLTFAYPIQNGPGFDFAVFENAFNNTFLELALVEVSSDGQRFVRFPAISNTDTSTQVGSFGAVDPTQIHHLAGKYRGGYGTPFDLEELRDSTGLDINAITHVRLIDAVGSINPAYGQRDSRGWLINDPWNTPFSSSGFDLDAVGVLHENRGIYVQQIPTAVEGYFYPNPLQNGQVLRCDAPTPLQTVALYNLQGQCLWRQASPTLPLRLPQLPAGIYSLTWSTDTSLYTQLLTLQP